MGTIFVVYPISKALDLDIQVGTFVFEDQGMTSMEYRGGIRVIQRSAYDEDQWLIPRFTTQQSGLQAGQINPLLHSDVLALKSVNIHIRTRLHHLNIERKV